jgi:hypothetical protein
MPNKTMELIFIRFAHFGTSFLSLELRCLSHIALTRPHCSMPLIAVNVLAARIQEYTTKYLHLPLGELKTVFVVGSVLGVSMSIILLPIHAQQEHGQLRHFAIA